MASIGASARTKGASAEREVIKVITAFLVGHLGTHTPKLTRNTAQTQNGGSDIVVVNPDGSNSVDIGGFAIEVKRVETNWLEAWWLQAAAQAQPYNLKPVVIHRVSKKPWVATLILEHSGVKVRATIPLVEFNRILLAGLTHGGIVLN